MVGIGNGRSATDERSGEKNSGFAGCEIFAPCENFQVESNSKPTATPVKQKTKNFEETNL